LPSLSRDSLNSGNRNGMNRVWYDTKPKWLRWEPGEWFRCCVGPEVEDDDRSRRKLPPLTSPRDFGRLSGFRKVPGQQFRPAAQAKSFVLRCLSLTQPMRIVIIEGYRQKWYAGRFNAL